MLAVLSLSNSVILIAGLGFALISIVVFYSYDLVQVSKNLNIAVVEAPQLLDLCLQEMHSIQNIRKIINEYKLATCSIDELAQLDSIIIMLQKRFHFLTETSVQFDKALNSNNLYVAKIIVSSLAGLLFFGSGFFAGQSVGLFVASQFIPGVLPIFLPVVLFSLIVGTSALCLFWYVELVGIKKLVSGWFGLDEDKIEVLCNKNNLLKEEKKLENIKEKVAAMYELKEYVVHVQKELAQIKPIVCVLSAESINPLEHSQTDELKIECQQTPALSKNKIDPVISSNIYAFHSKPQTSHTADLDLILPKTPNLNSF